MTPNSVGDWIAWSGLLLPLLVIAWSAYQYVGVQRREQEYRQFDKFHKLMIALGTPGSGVMGQMAVAYELRKFPQYREVIVRAMEDIMNGGLVGSAADLLASEFEMTIKALGGRA